jgi:hypothetical protein
MVVEYVDPITQPAVLASALLKEVREIANAYPPDQPCPYRLLLLHGVGRFCTRNRWKGVRRGKLRKCYWNALNLVLENPSRHIYCEGVANSAGVFHAWVLDAEAGYRVIDPTWRKTAGSVYLGIPFSRQYIRQVAIKTDQSGVNLNDPELYSLDPAEYLHPETAYIASDFLRIDD